MDLVQPDILNHTYSITIPQDIRKMRLDAYLVQQFSKYSRTFFQKLIDETLVLVNDKPSKASYQIKPADVISITIPPASTVSPILSKDAIAEIKKVNVTIIFQHPEFLIINKPAGLIVHKPSISSKSITLVDWLLFYFSEIVSVGNQDRPGIVHRLDKDTSGLMIVARTMFAHVQFSAMFKESKIQKTYLAVVNGQLTKSGTINLPVGRDIFQPTKMSTISQSSRPALTNYEIVTNFPNATLVKVFPITGRTHQIRVHFAAIGHPIIGDQVYGEKSNLIARQALHATQLVFTFESETYSFTAEPPADFNNLLEQL